MTDLFRVMIRRLTQFLVVSFFALSIFGCAGKSVLFNEEANGILDDTADDVVYRVFFDREGYIYPATRGDGFVDIDTDDFSDGAKTGYLQRYFCENPIQLEIAARQAGIKNYQQLECSIDEDAQEGYIGAIKYDVSSEQDSWLDQWEIIQEGLLERQAEELASLFKQERNENRQLFILIHGYNNSFGSIKSNYETVRNALKRSEKNKEMDFVFLDVYWDGFVQSLPLNIWGPAQYTGPLVGARMRKLLKNMEPTRAIRVLTHSSGAFVAGSLIGDSRKALTLWENEFVCEKGHKTYDQSVCHFKRTMMLSTETEETSNFLEDYRVLKTKDIRVGMIAPATSSWTFTGGCSGGLEEGRGLLKPAGTLRLIVGQHEDDFANSKLVGLESAKGFTTLGVRKSSFCEIQKHVTDTKRSDSMSNIDIHRVDFKTENKEPYPKFIFRADHALNAYLNREKAPDFISLLLDIDTVPNMRLDREENNCVDISVPICED